MTFSAASPGSRCIEPLLVLNGAEERLQLVLGRRRTAGGEYELAHSQEWVAPGQAARFLAPAVQYALTAAGIAPRELVGVACVRGPGGFTGLRLVLATALGLAKACDLPLAGLEYLPLLATQALGTLAALSGPTSADAATPPAGSVFVITHARRDQAHVQGFIAGKGAAQGGWTAVPLDAPAALDLETVSALAAAGPAPRLVCGGGARRHRAFFQQRWGKKVIVLDQSYEHPLPATLLAAAAGQAYARKPIEPLYLRPSDAEANLPEIARKAGLDAAAMAQRLAAFTS